MFDFYMATELGSDQWIRTPWKPRNQPTTMPDKTKPKTLTVVSPYYLHPSDKPESLISPVQLKADNYEEWVRPMRNAWRAKKKLGFVEGTLTKPSDDSAETEDWWMVNPMLVAWIFNTIELTLSSTVTYTETVKELWDDLRHRFSIGNGARVYQLKANLAACKQHGQTIVQYYQKLKMMWDELVHYEPIPICSCRGCRCRITAILEKKNKKRRGTSTSIPHGTRWRRIQNDFFLISWAWILRQI